MFERIKPILRKRLVAHGALHSVEGAHIKETITRLLVARYGVTQAKEVRVRSVRSGVIELTASSSSMCHDILTAHDELIQQCNAELSGVRVTRIRCVG